MPKVTVLLTSYNHETFVGKAIESVLNQTYTDYELLIVDDCSKDDSWAVITRYQDPRIIAIQNSRNVGPERAFEIMLERARGEYVAIFHSDDLWRPEKLEKQVAYLDRHPEIGAVFTDVEIVGEDGLGGVEYPGFSNIFKTENCSRQEWLRYFFYHGNCLCHPSVLIRRQCYTQCGMTTNSMAQLPDFYKWVKLLKVWEIAILPEKLTCYRVLAHEGNTSAPNLKNSVRSMTEMYTVFSEYFTLSDEDILKVFPQTEQYVVEGNFNGTYALARVFIEESAYASVVFLGIERLAGLLEGSAREEIETLYGYNFLSHIALTAKYNIFNLKSNVTGLGLQHNKAELYWDTGSGFAVEQRVTADYVSDDTGYVHLTMEIPEDAPVYALRFDPCDDYRALIVLKSFCADGADLRSALCFNGTAQGEVHVFLHTDPQYVVRFQSPAKVKTVSAELYIGDDMQSFMNQFNRHTETAFTPVVQEKTSMWTRLKRRIFK